MIPCKVVSTVVHLMLMPIQNIIDDALFIIMITFFFDNRFSLKKEGDIISFYLLLT
jgi:hypothetical protein